MNIAFPALLLLVLLLPGLIYLLCYQGRLAGRFSSHPVIDVRPMSIDWVLALILSPIFHLLWITISGPIAPVSVDLNSVFSLLVGLDTGTKSAERAISSMSAHFAWIVLYFSSLFAFSAVLGTLIHMAIRRFELDTKTEFFRFNNEWHYILSGELNESKADGTLISVTMDYPDGTFLYSGFLDSFSYASNGDLQKIVLTGTVRRSITKDRKQGQAQAPADDDNRFYRVEGNKFVVWCKDVATLNIRYYKSLGDGQLELL